MQQPKTPRFSNLRIIIAGFAVIIMAVIIFALTSQNGDKKDTSPQAVTPAASSQQQAEIKRRLCYVKFNRVGCYTDDKLAATSVPSVWEDLDDVIRVVPSVADDKLAVIAGSPGEYRIYISDSSFRLTRVSTLGYTKTDDSVSWLPDGTGLVFEAGRANATENSRLILRYDQATKKLTELTKSNVLSTDPQVSDASIVFRRYGLIANPTTAWQWYKMNLDGSSSTDLGVKGVDGAVSRGKLIVASDYPSAPSLTEVDIATKKQRSINFAGLKIPTSSSSGLVTLIDGRLAYAFKDDESKPGVYDRIGLINLATQKMQTVTNVGVGYPFQTQLFNNR